MKHIIHVEEKLSYENRSTIMQEMNDKAKAKAEAGWRIDAPEISNTIIPLILSARPGTQTWFSHAAKTGLTFFEEFPQKAKDNLPSKVIRCLTKLFLFQQELSKRNNHTIECRSTIRCVFESPKISVQ